MANCFQTPALDLVCVPSECCASLIAKAKAVLSGDPCASVCLHLPAELQSLRHAIEYLLSEVGRGRFSVNFDVFH